MQLFDSHVPKQSYITELQLQSSKQQQQFVQLWFGQSRFEQRQQFCNGCVQHAKCWQRKRKIMKLSFGFIRKRRRVKMPSDIGSVLSQVCLLQILFSHKHSTLPTQLIQNKSSWNQVNYRHPELTKRQVGFCLFGRSPGMLDRVTVKIWTSV